MSDDFDPDEYLKKDTGGSSDDFDPDTYLGKSAQPTQIPKPTWTDKNIVTPVANAYKNIVTGVRDAPPLAERIPLAGPVIKYLTDLPTAAATGRSLAETSQAGDVKARQYAQEHPVMDVAQDIGASMALPVPEAKVAAEGAGALSKLGTGAYNIGQRMVSNVGTSAADAALRGQDPMEAGANTAKMTGKVEAGLLAGKGLAKVAGPVLFGVANETGDYYRKNRADVNSASMDRTKNAIDDTVEGLRNSSEEASTALNEAKMDKKVADRQLTNDLRQTDIPEGLPGNIVEARKQLRSDISKASGEQFDLLSQKNETVATPKIKAYVTQKLNDLNIAGKAPPPGSAEEAGYKKLQGFREWLNSMPKDLRPEDAKRIVQYCDSELDSLYSSNAGYVSKGDRSLKDIRQFIDDDIKTQHPDYAKGMEAVAHKTKLANNLEDYFDNEKQGFRSLRNLDAPENIKARQSLEELGKQTGNDFIKPISEYESAQRAVKDPQTLDFLKSGLPETDRLAAAQSDSASHDLWYDPVKRAGPLSTQNIVKSTGARPGKNIENEKLLDYLGDISGQNFRKQARDIGVQQSFEHGFTNGSRNVNLHALSLAGLVSMVAPGHSEGAKGAGAVIGAMMDKSGPQVYKAILDTIDTPAFQKYAPVLKEALQRSPAAFAVRAHLLSQKDPNFAKIYNQSQGGEQ